MNPRIVIYYCNNDARYFRRMCISTVVMESFILVGHVDNHNHPIAIIHYMVICELTLKFHIILKYMDLFLIVWIIIQSIQIKNDVISPWSID